MELSSDLMSQFAKITNDEKNVKNETTVYGTISKQGNTIYVKLDGSELLTPVASTAEVEDKERVMIMLKNHTATVTGNITSPAARIGTVNKLADEHGNRITQIDNTINQQSNVITQINNTINQQNNSINQQNNNITQINNSINQQNNTITAINNNISIYNSSFQITNGVVTGIKGIDTEWITTKDLAADHATIESLDTKYANVDFANIGDAAMNNFYANSGLIKDVTVKDGTVTGELIGVTIKGDLIEANTLVANKLVVQGEDGLYYRLNTDGVKVEAEQTDYNSLNGSVIVAKSVTASKISVSDLVAFDATIGGFKITEDSIYSGVKESIDNTTRGIYLDNTGQIAFGDATNYLKYYKASDGSYKLTIASESIDDAAKTATNYLNFSSNGLIVGDNTGDTLGGNVLIDSDSVDIRNGETVYASYGADYIYLGKNNKNTEINLCDGSARMYYMDVGNYGKYFHMDSDDHIGMYSNTGVTLDAVCERNNTQGEATIEVLGYTSRIGDVLTPGGYISIAVFTSTSGTNSSTTTAAVTLEKRRVSITGELYSPYGVTVDSDIRLKDNISTNMDKYIAMLDLLEPISYTWKTEADNPDKRTYISYGAQYIWEAMREVGLAETDFAGFRRDTENDKYHLNFENFIPILHAKIKQLENRINELETQ